MGSEMHAPSRSQANVPSCSAFQRGEEKEGRYEMHRHRTQIPRYGLLSTAHAPGRSTYPGRVSSSCQHNRAICDFVCITLPARHLILSPNNCPTLILDEPAGSGGRGGRLWGGRGGRRIAPSADGVPGGAGEHADEFVARVRGPGREGGVSESCVDGDAEVEQKMYGAADGAAE
ncbi:hypothetical protein FIBSPDRAFT_598648 [Athelia psychrophila]|uniref:Uncharacterized protein n=1 Tax=Athelia psychrophila TaxID=1759441 RepID=A0A166GYW5_9AGAM|nr:hypothetical protein FIBSPDRAFT_598648 [Fibularhizoctonia sp. CBS 109695]